MCPFTLMASSPAHAGISVVAIDGVASPKGGSLAFFSGATPVINDSGDVAFYASLRGSNSGRRNNQAVFRARGINLVELARAGQSIEGSTHKIDTIGHDVILNDAGYAVMQGTTFVTLGGEFEGYGIWNMGDGLITQLARDGQSTGEVGLEFAEFGYQPTFNDAGQFAFQASVNKPPEDGFAIGVFLADGTTLKQIARSRQPAPDGNGQLWNLYNVSLNNVGHVAFAGTFANPTGDPLGSGVFRSDGATLTQVVRTGQATPDGLGVFQNFGSDIALNDIGQLTFLAGVRGESDTSNRPAIYRQNGAMLSPVIRYGESVAGAPGRFSRFSSPSQNAVGDLALLADVTETGSAGDKEAILYIDQSGLHQVARAGDPVPGGSGEFSKFSDGRFFDPPISLSNSGQMAFLAELVDTPGGAADNAAIFLFDPSAGVKEILQKGAPFLGSTIADLELSSDIGAMGEVANSINSISQIAFGFGLADGRRGIAVWSIPEPSTFVLSAVLALFVRRARRLYG